MKLEPRRSESSATILALAPIGDAEPGTRPASSTS